MCTCILLLRFSNRSYFGTLRRYCSSTTAVFLVLALTTFPSKMRPLVFRPPWRGQRSSEQDPSLGVLTGALCTPWDFLEFFLASSWRGFCLTAGDVCAGLVSSAI